MKKSNEEIFKNSSFVVPCFHKGCVFSAWIWEADRQIRDIPSEMGPQGNIEGAPVSD
jgi:hypothetical protein